MVRVSTPKKTGLAGTGIGIVAFALDRLAPNLPEWITLGLLGLGVGLIGFTIAQIIWTWVFGGRDVDDLKGWSVSANLGMNVFFIMPAPHPSMIGFQGSRFINLSTTQTRHLDVEILFPGPNGEAPVVLKGPDARQTQYRKGVSDAAPPGTSRSHDAIQLPITLEPGAIVEGQLEFEADPVQMERIGMYMGPDARTDMPEPIVRLIEHRANRSVEFKRSQCYDAEAGTAVEAPPITLGPGTHVLARMVVPQLQPREPPVGSLQYVMLKPDVEAHRGAGKFNVRLKVELENATDSLLTYEIVGLSGEVNGKTVPDPENPQIADRTGLVYPRKRTYVMYERIDDVDLSSEVISGRFQYLLRYTTMPPAAIRTTGRTLVFETPISLEKHPTGTSRAKLMTVNSLNVIEE